MAPDDNSSSLINLREFGEAEPFLSLDLRENMLNLNYSNITLQTDVNETLCFFVRIQQYFTDNTVGILALVGIYLLL